MPSLQTPGIVITDPPYGSNLYKTDKAVSGDFYSWLVKNFETVAIFGYPEILVGICMAINLAPSEWVTWWPTNKASGRSNSRLPKEVECVAVFGKTPGASLLFRKRSGTSIGVKISKTRGLSSDYARLGDVWRDASPGMAFLYRMRKHPNEKPLSLMEKLVTLCSNPGDTIIDPFMGSGTTGEAAIRTGRKFIGIEKEPEFYRVAETRLQQAQPPLPLGATQPGVAGDGAPRRA